MADDWEAVFAQEAGSSSCLADLIEDACQCRENSDSESETLDEVESPDSPHVWWVDTLRQVFQDAGVKWPRPLREPLQVVSACTGCSAEAAVLKAGCSMCLAACDHRYSEILMSFLNGQLRCRAHSPWLPFDAHSPWLPFDFCAGIRHALQPVGGLGCLR